MNVLELCVAKLIDAFPATAVSLQELKHVFLFGVFQDFELLLRIS